MSVCLFVDETDKNNWTNLIEILQKILLIFTAIKFFCLFKDGVNYLTHYRKVLMVVYFKNKAYTICYHGNQII